MNGLFDEADTPRASEIAVALRELLIAGDESDRAADSSVQPSRARRPTMLRVVEVQDGPTVELRPGNLLGRISSPTPNMSIPNPHISILAESNESLYDKSRHSSEEIAEANPFFLPIDGHQ